MNHSSNGAKQTKETARKGERIRALRSQGVKWGAICREIGIFKENGDPDTGLAYRIAFDGYEPKHREVRERLGLRDVCLACMRSFRKSVRAAALSPWRVWWKRLSPRERDRWIHKNYDEGNNKR